MKVFTIIGLGLALCLSSTFLSAKTFPDTLTPLSRNPQLLLRELPILSPGDGRAGIYFSGNTYFRYKNRSALCLAISQKHNTLSFGAGIQYFSYLQSHLSRYVFFLRKKTGPVADIGIQLGISFRKFNDHTHYLLPSAGIFGEARIRNNSQFAFAIYKSGLKNPGPSYPAETLIRVNMTFYTFSKIYLQSTLIFHNSTAPLLHFAAHFSASNSWNISTGFSVLDNMLSISLEKNLSHLQIRCSFLAGSRADMHTQIDFAYLKNYL